MSVLELCETSHYLHMAQAAVTERHFRLPRNTAAKGVHRLNLGVLSRVLQSPDGPKPLPVSGYG